VAKQSGDAKITWNNVTKKLDIAAGLAAGVYQAVFRATNGYGADATLTFTLTIVDPISPGISAPAALILPHDYTAAFTGAFTVTGAPAPTVMKVSGSEKITWDDGAKKLHIAAGLAPGTYTVVLEAGNGVGNDATVSYTVTVSPKPPKTIFSTAYEASVCNWLLFFLCFGWIWMWF
jgi:hypothetical protein